MDIFEPNKKIKNYIRKPITVIPSLLNEITFINNLNYNSLTIIFIVSELKNNQGLNQNLKLI